MRVVGIDGHNLALPRGTGVATYARNLANNLHEMGAEVSTLYGAPISGATPALLREVQFFDYLGGQGSAQHWTRHARQIGRQLWRSAFGYRAIEIPRSGKVEIRRFDERLPREARIFNVSNLFNIARWHFKLHGRFLEVKLPQTPDIMHWTYPLPIKVAGAANIYTIHDLVPLRLPYTTLDNKKYYHALIRQCIAGADRICTVSERSKIDIVELFNVDEDRISNTYQDVDVARWLRAKSRQDACAEVEGIFGLPPQGYFLFFGAIEPKKNVGRLVEAFLSSRIDTRLVIVGTPAWKSSEEMKLINELTKEQSPVMHRITVLDYVPRAMLVSLIRAAKAVVFPSLYEGFGLPVVEAMQLGTPTLCSTGGSLPEIVADASLCVDPYDTGDMARGLQALDQDGDLRQTLSAKGLARAQHFDSATYRRRLDAMYARLVSG